MATTVNAVQTTGFANRYSENVLNYNLAFQSPFSAEVVSGSGITNVSQDYVYALNKSFYVRALTNDLLLIQAPSDEWTTLISSYRLTNNAIFQFSCYNANPERTTGRFRFFEFEFETYVVEFDLEPAEAGWITYFQNIIVGGGDLSIQIEFDAMEDENLVELYFGGIKLEYDQDINYTPTPYSPPTPIEINHTETIDIPSIGSNDTELVNVTILGAKLGMFVNMTSPPAITTIDELVIGQPIVSATDTVSFIVHNHSGGAINPASGDFKFRVYE